jgi:hypothetical protein
MHDGADNFVHRFKLIKTPKPGSSGDG